MATLEGLPNEIVETIVTYLDLESIRNLRQTSHTLSAKATQDRFKSFFYSKRVDITRPSLEAFVEATSAGRLGYLLQNLTLVGIVNNTKWLAAKAKQGEHEAFAQDFAILQERQEDFDEMHEAGIDVELLTQAFANLKASGKRQISSLFLAVEIYRENAETRLQPVNGGSWKMIWQSAVDTYRTALSSLSASGLHMNQLNVFEGLQRCSIAANEIDLPEVPGLADILASLGSLSISLSDTIVEECPTDIGDTGDGADSIDWEAADEVKPLEEIQDEVDRPSNYRGLATFLQYCPKLEELVLHQYKLDLQTRMPEIRFRRERYMQHIAETVHLSRLRNLTLRGLETTAEVLLSFLRRATALQEISLQHVRLCQGTFREFFDYCTSDDNEIERLYFDDLFESSDGMIFFEGFGVPKFMPMNRPCSNTLERSGRSEIKRPISYCHAEGLPIGTPSLAQWRQECKMEYGSVTM